MLVRAFDWCQIYRLWMTLNGGNVSLLEIEKSCGAHQKNLNEDRPISLVAKCRPMILLAKYKVYADMRRGSIGEGHHVGYWPLIGLPASMYYLTV